MDTLQQKNLPQSQKQAVGPYVSIYMPVKTAESEICQNPVRLKILLLEAKHQLTGILEDEDEANRLLRPVFGRLEDGHFWGGQGHGVAILIGPNGYHSYWLEVGVEEFVAVGQQYFLHPLLPAHFAASCVKGESTSR